MSCCDFWQSRHGSCRTWWRGYCGGRGQRKKRTPPHSRYLSAPSPPARRRAATDPSTPGSPPRRRIPSAPITRHPRRHHKSPPAVKAHIAARSSGGGHRPPDPAAGGGLRTLHGEILMRAGVVCCSCCYIEHIISETQEGRSEELLSVMVAEHSTWRGSSSLERIPLHLHQVFLAMAVVLELQPCTGSHACRTEQCQMRPRSSSWQ
ncbi:hypothetical protein E2562_007927 [Oryza meyeriana var. granulata]|uniref:Uncharacterized protein n=1 Tax=Oryza meyeriana var. granulata TaxID=110450 RepID=A0A6G1DW55_9ORYZ|nr:hypothetical protein E2562_007927 [Oryza meyeriana var. granulata]